jgi:hypothetical protein
MASEQGPDHNDESPEEAIQSGRPRPRNPFDTSASDDAEQPALIETKRAAAIWGVLAGFVLLALVVGICIMANYAFG